MFFYASKLGLLMFQPTSLCLLAITVGLLASRTRTGQRLALGGTAALLLLGFSPVANWLVRPLEQRFPKPDLNQIGGRVAGIVILGGFEDTWVSRGRKELALTDAAERFTEGVRLAQRLPQAKVLFTGGTGDVFESEGAADLVAGYLVAFGIARERIILEKTSRTTAENATLSKAIANPKAGEIWLLVTSAQHMPRSIGVFRRQGFDVLAWPVDYRTAGGSGDWLSGFSSASEGWRRADFAVREWYGLVGYWLSGRSRELFPGP